MMAYCRRGRWPRSLSLHLSRILLYTLAAKRDQAIVQQRTRIFLRRLGIALAIPVLLYAALSAWSMLALRSAYADLARDGRPMTAADVIPPPVPPADNAALFYREAIRLLKVAEDHSPALPQTADSTVGRNLRREKHTPDTLLQKLSDAARTATATNAMPDDIIAFRDLMTRPDVQQALDLVVLAGERKGCRFPVYYSAGLRLANSQLFSDLWSLNQIVPDEVIRLTVAGDSSNACRLAVAGLGLAGAQRTEPVLLSHHVTILFAARAMVAVRQLGAATPLRREQYNQLLFALMQLDQPAEFQQALDGERLLFGEWAFTRGPRDIVDELWSKGRYPWAKSIGRVLWDPMLRLDHATYLRLLQQEASAPLASNPPRSPVPRFCCFTRMLLPDLARARDSSLSHLARVRCTAAGLAVLKYRQEHGTWPESLARIAPGMTVLPKDPFDGMPLRYHVTENGFVVYSIGKDRKDDGGSAALDDVWRFAPAWPAASTDTLPAPQP